MTAHTHRLSLASLAILDRRRLALFSALLLGGALCVAAMTHFIIGRKSHGLDQVGDVTASLSAAPEQIGPSGLPLPRFVTLKAGKVNVRKGPSSDHAVAWVFQRKGLPVEITAEFENWRKVRDSDGGEGWILQSMLSGKRNALIADWTKGKAIFLRDDGSDKAAAIVQLSAGVVGEIQSCNGLWCYVATADYAGYAKQSELWGVYPGEIVD